MRCLTTTVGDVMERHHISKVSLLKINVERAEESVLLGVTQHDWPRIDQVSKPSSLAPGCVNLEPQPLAALALARPA